MAKVPEKQSVHWGVQLFVFFHLAAITAWSLPNPPARVISGEAELSLKEAPNFLLDANAKYIKTSPLGNYFISTGLWQYWDMFSPNPSNVDTWLDAIITYEDGKQLRYQYPRMKLLPVHTKYFKERYRKFLDNSHKNRYSYKWPAMAQRIAYLNYEGEENLALTVELRRHFKIIRPPADGNYSNPEGQIKDYTTVTFYVHLVDQEKLVRDAAE